jgi:hypothetical protein
MVHTSNHPLPKPIKIILPTSLPQITPVLLLMASFFSPRLIMSSLNEKNRHVQAMSLQTPIQSFNPIANVPLNASLTTCLLLPLSHPEVIQKEPVLPLTAAVARPALETCPTKMMTETMMPKMTILVIMRMMSIVPNEE